VGRRRRGEPRNAVAASTDIDLEGGVDTLETTASITQPPDMHPATRPDAASPKARRPRIALDLDVVAVGQPCDGGRRSDLDDLALAFFGFRCAKIDLVQGERIQEGRVPPVP